MKSHHYLQQTQRQHANESNALCKWQLQFPHGGNGLDKEEKIGDQVKDELRVASASHPLLIYYCSDEPLTTRELVDPSTGQQHPRDMRR
jgi:hypothetical protein